MTFADFNAELSAVQFGAAEFGELGLDVTVAPLDTDYLEDRVRAATSGFELGDFEPAAQ